MKKIAHSIIMILLFAVVLPAGASELRSYAAPDDSLIEVKVGTGSVYSEQANDFPQHLQDKDQNRHADGSASATVVRNRRGGYLLVPDSLFKPQRISKFYPRKRFLDKAMIDFGAGLNYGIGTSANGTYGMGPAPQFQMGLTDWATPEHGWHLGLTIGQLPLKVYDKGNQAWTNYRPNRFGLSADYFFNISALASRSYQRPDRVEMILVAGAEADAINYTDDALNNQWTYNLGLHMGLRGVFNLSPICYLYLQPQVGVNKASTFFSFDRDGGEGYAFNASLNAGIGLRRDARYSAVGHVSDTLKLMRNGLFLELGAGLHLHQNSPRTLGPEFALSLGRWFDYTNGLRLRGAAGILRNPSRGRIITASAGVDYMWNVSRFFAIRSGNIKAQASPWNLNLAVGGGVGLSRHASTGISIAPHGGVGVQLGVRTGGATQFFLEPRVDVYAGNYIPFVRTTNDKQFDVVPSLRAGFSFNQRAPIMWVRRANNHKFATLPFQHHFFVQGGVGIVAPVTLSLITTSELLHVLEPAARLSVGKWFTPVHGLRFYGEGGRLKEGTTLSASNYVSFGAEYLWNITNSISKGYRDYRPLEFIFGLGLNNGTLLNSGKAFNPALSATLQAHYNINKRWSVFVEPQLRVYGKDLLTHRGPKFDPVASLMIGTQLRTVGYNYRIVRDSTDWHKGGFIGFAAGPSASLRPHTLGFSGRLSIGQWFTPVSALRMNLGYQNLRFEAFDCTSRQQKVLIGADYMVDLLNLSYGYRSRHFHIRPLAGVNIGTGWQSGKSATFEGDLHAGLQFSFDLKRGNEIYLEPQLSYIWGNSHVRRIKHFQPIFYVGLQKNASSIGGAFIALSRDLADIRRYNAETYSWDGANKWYNKWFYELGAGLNILWGDAAQAALDQYVGFGGHAAVGRWFTRMSGVRLRFLGDRLYAETDHGKMGFEMMGLGLDYAHSLTTAIWGYNPDRHIDINAYAGLRLMWQTSTDKVVPGFNVALQPMVNISRSVGLYLQPEITFYGKKALQTDRSISSNFTTHLSLGLQVHPQNYNYAGAKLLYDEEGGHCFFSLAGGGGMPLRNMSAKRDEWFLTGRFSYGNWFSPLSAWRANVEGWASPRDFHTRTRSGRITLGGDYLFDVTTLAYSRMDNRLFNFRPVVGFNMGLAYMAHLDGLLHFQGDVHAGVQMGINVSRRVELYLEPQLAHVWSGFSEQSRLTPVQPTMLAGLTYRLTSYANEVIKNDVGTDQPHHFISIGAGTGFNSHILTGGQELFRFKMSVDADVNYGYWFNAIHGLRAGLGMSTMHLGAKRYPNIQLTNLTLHADYLLNLLNIFRGPDALNQRAELVAYAGLNYNFSMAPGRTTRNAPGAEVGFWAGLRVTPKVTLFLEPTIQVQSPRLYNSYHPIDGTVRLLGGAKFAF